MQSSNAWVNRRADKIIHANADTTVLQQKQMLSGETVWYLKAKRYKL